MVGRDETVAQESDSADSRYPPPSSDEIETAEIDVSGGNSHFPAVCSHDGLAVLRHILNGQTAEAEAALRDVVGAPVMAAKPDEVQQLTEAVLDLILYPSATAAPSTSTDAVASGSSSHSRVEQADPEAATHYGSTLTRRAIRFLHFLRVHGQPRTEAMYGSLIRRILDQGHVDLAARVYVELVEEWAWEQKRSVGRAAGVAQAGDPFDAIEEEIGWLRKVEWVDPAKEDVWAFEKWRRGPEAAEEDLPGQPYEEERFALFRERRRKEAEAAALGGSAHAQTAAEVEIAQHKHDLEQDAPFSGFFGGLRWNHRAEAQRRTLCWAPSPSRLRLYLRRFPPSVSQVPKAVRLTTIPFPSMALLNPILERAAGNLTSLSPYGSFAKSASALAIVANTVHSRTLPLSHVSVLIRTFDYLPQYPRVRAPLPSPDPVDDTTAYTHVQSALASLVYGLPPGSMTENVERFGLNSISEGSANSLLSYTLTTLNSPTKGEKVLSYMRCQGYLNSPASSRTTGQILIKAGLTTKVWRYFVDGFQMAVGEMAGAFVRLLHERPATPEALSRTRGSQWQLPTRLSQTHHLRVTLELPEHPLPPPAPSPSDRNGPVLESEAVEGNIPSSVPVREVTSKTAAPLQPVSLPTRGASTNDGRHTSTKEGRPSNDEIDSFPYPTEEELGPNFETLFQSFLQSSSAHDSSATATALLDYAAAAGRYDLVLQMYNYLLGRHVRPVPMTAALYGSLILILVKRRYERTAEQVFCLARKELMAQGLDLEVDVYVAMLAQYAQIRRRTVGRYLPDGTFYKNPRSGHVYPGEPEPAERALRGGWGLYRGMVWGQWEHWAPVQDRILYNDSPFPRRKWFIQGPQLPSTVIVSADPTGEPEFRPLPSANLSELFNAAITLMRVQEGMAELPRHVLRSKDLLRAMIATVKKKALNARRADAPELAGADFYLSLVALDIRRAGFSVPLGVELLLAKYPQYHERIQQVQPIRPLSTLREAEADLGFAYSVDPFNLPVDVRASRRCRPEPTFSFDGAEMDRLGSAALYPAGSFEGCDISPSDWPLLVWAALEGRVETDFNLPPGLWDAALELKDNFAISKDGQYLLLVGRLGDPVPFVPSRNRDEFIALNTPPELAGRPLDLRDRRLFRALGRAGWWPGIERDIRDHPRALWRERRADPDYQAGLARRIDDVVRSGARREEPAACEQKGDENDPDDEHRFGLGQPSTEAGLPRPPWAAGLGVSLRPLAAPPTRTASALPRPPKLAAPPLPR